jgi:hypothetical protein
VNIKKDETEVGEKRKIRVHSLIMQKYNTQGGRGGREKGGGGRLLYNQSLHELGDM